MTTLVLQDERTLAKFMVTGAAYFILIAIGLNNNTFIAAKELAMNITNTTNTHTGSAPKAELFFDEDALKVAKELWAKDVQRRYPKSTVLTIRDGVKHIRLTKYINGRPIRINVVEANFNLDPNIAIKPVLASNQLKKRTPIRYLAAKENTIAAINGSYFKPDNGIPLGTLMIDGDLLTGPIYDRVALGITNNGFKMDRVKFNSTLTYKDNTLKIDNINQPRMLAKYTIIYNRKWGINSPPSPQYGAQIAIEDNKIVQVSNGSMTIPEKGYVIVGPREKLEPFFNANKVNLKIAAGDESWGDVTHIISGGPYLVKNGNVFVDVKEQKLNAISGRNPRTAIGYTQDNKFIMVTVDGREQNSVGMNIWELAKFMKSIGCYNAMNLDGGGSSIMLFNGKTVNTPSSRGGIPISNALVLYSTENIKLANQE